MSRDSRLYLYDIKTAIHKIQSYSSKMTLEQLLSDALVTDAIILNLLIIGEAVNKLPSELTKTQKHIPLAFPRMVASSNHSGDLGE